MEEFGAFERGALAGEFAKLFDALSESNSDSWDEFQQDMRYRQPTAGIERISGKVWTSPGSWLMHDVLNCHRIYYGQLSSRQSIIDFVEPPTVILFRGLARHIRLHEMVEIACFLFYDFYVQNVTRHRTILSCTARPLKNGNHNRVTTGNGSNCIAQ